MERVRPKAKLLETDQGQLPYDVLVIATGSRPKFFGAFAEQAGQMLQANRELLENLAEKLLEDEELDDKQIAELIGPSVHNASVDADQ